MLTASVLDQPTSPEVPAMPGDSMTDMERRLRDMIEAASDWFWETDRDFRFVYVSPRIAVITGITPEVLKGKRWDEVAPTEVGKGSRFDVLLPVEPGSPVRTSPPTA